MPIISLERKRLVMEREARSVLSYLIPSTDMSTKIAHLKEWIDDLGRQDGFEAIIADINAMLEQLLRYRTEVLFFVCRELFKLKAAVIKMKRNIRSLRRTSRTRAIRNNITFRRSLRTLCGVAEITLGLLAELLPMRDDDYMRSNDNDNKLLSTLLWLTFDMILDINRTRKLLTR